MAKTVGKQFETDFAASIPEDVYFQRIKDPAQSFGGSGNTSFSPSNPYDCYMYSCPHLFVLELKTTKSSLTFWRSDFEQKGRKPSFNIRKHQIIGLQNADAHHGVIAGFILNFRSVPVTYFVPIQRFCDYTSKLSKKSVNETDISSIGILIPQRQLRVNWRYDICHLIEMVGAETGR